MIQADASRERGAKLKRDKDGKLWRERGGTVARESWDQGGVAFQAVSDSAVFVQDKDGKLWRIRQVGATRTRELWEHGVAVQTPGAPRYRAAGRPYKIERHEPAPQDLMDLPQPPE